MKTPKRYFNERVATLRRAIATIDSSKASAAEKAEAREVVMGGDRGFWLLFESGPLTEKESALTLSPREVVAMKEVAKVSDLPVCPLPEPAPKKPVKREVSPVATANKPVASGNASPGAPLPAPKKPAVSTREPLTDFGKKINQVAGEVGLVDNSIVGRFRQAIQGDGKGSEYWNHLREVTEDAIRGAVLNESDWNLLVEKMKKNLFFTGKVGEMFIERCPKDKLENLLLDQGGLIGLVARIKTEDRFSPSFVYWISFVLDACHRVGDEAKALRINSAHVVNRMCQKGWIPNEHWLVQKVAKGKGGRVATAIATRTETATKGGVRVEPAEKPETPEEFGKTVSGDVGENPTPVTIN